MSNLISGGYGITGAIAGGVAAGAALLFAAPAIAFAWWRRRKPLDIFFDVPGEFIIPISFFSVIPFEQFLASNLLY